MSDDSVNGDIYDYLFIDMLTKTISNLNGYTYSQHAWAFSHASGLVHTLKLLRIARI